MASTKPRYIIFSVLFLIIVTCPFLAIGQDVSFCGAQTLPSTANQEMYADQDKFERDYQKLVKSESFQSRTTRYTLPVVFHIIHNGGVENISDSQVLTGLDHLNAAFKNTGYYNDQIGEDVELQFCLASRDPNDNSTTGINHIQSDLTNFNKDSQDQALKNVIRWNPSSYINIWVVNEICSNNDCKVAGYAYFPSSHGSDVDGIVMEASYLGSSPAKTTVLVHEMGHYLGLYHTFQGGCFNNDCLSQGDRVCDTPPDQSTSRPPCSSMTNTCTTDVNSSDSNNPFTSDQHDMINNYMDYSNLACYSAFTLGQKDRIHFSIEHKRFSLLDSKACLEPCLNPISLEIFASNDTVNVGKTVNFSSSATGATSYQWLINGVPFGNTPSTNFTFNTEGTYTIELIANNSDPNCEERTTVEIKVNCPVVAAFVTSGSDVKPNTEVIFSNISQNANAYQWLLNGIPVSNNFNFSSSFFAEGTYDIQLISSNGLCSDTSSIKVITVSELGIAGTGLPIWPIISTNSGVIETVDWNNGVPVIKTISDSGDIPTGQAGVAINSCGDVSFYAIQPGSSDPNNLNLYLPDGAELLSENTPNGPGLNGVRGNNEIQVVRVPTYSNEWYIIYSQWSSDSGALASNAIYTPAKILYSRVKLNHEDHLVVLERDIELTANGSTFTYTDGKATSRTAYGSSDQHFFYACRRASGNSYVSIDRFLITHEDIKWEKNTGNVTVPWWNLSIAGSPIELSPTEDRIAVACRNQSTGQPDVLIFNTDSFSSSDHISISAGDLVLVADGTANDLSSILASSDKVKNIAADISLNLRFLRNYERKLSRIEFSPNGRFLYLNTGGFNQNGTSNLTYLSQIDLESNPMNVRMQIQTPPDGIYDPITGIGCQTSAASCLDAYPGISEVQSSYDGKLYFTKRHDNKFYVIPNPNDILPQNLIPGDINLETALIPNIDVTGRTGSMPDQIDGYDYVDERFSSIEFNTNALDCNDDCLAPYDIEIYLGNYLIESFEADKCPDTIQFCCDTSKVYRLYSPSTNLSYDSAIVFGQVHYLDDLGFFDFSDLSECIEVCDNLIDDDNDGLIDCDDPDLQDSCCCYIPPLLELGPDVETCVNGVFTLDAGDFFASYRWSNLMTESTTTVYEPGQYWVEVTDRCGHLQVDSINIIWESQTQIELGEDISICNGESVELTLAGFDTYEWFPVSGIDCSDCEVIIVNPDTTTSYIVVASKNGCSSIDTIVVYVNEESYEILDTSICSNDVIVIGNVALGAGDTQIFILQNEEGCDSTFEVRVSDVGFQSYEIFIDTLICQNTAFHFLGTEYYAFTKDTLQFQSFYGCDSTIYINVEGIPNPATNEIKSICYGESIDIFGNAETTSGDYSKSFLSESLCDSTHTITLLIQEEIIASVESISTCQNDNTGSISVAISGGTPPYSYEWSNGEVDTDVIENVGLGEYQLLVTDHNNCQISITAEVDAFLEMELVLEIKDSICFGESDGIIDLSGNPSGFTFSLDNETFIANPVFDNLSAGFYTIYGLDKHGCRYDTSVELYELEEIYVQLPEDTTILFGESFVIYPATNAQGDLIYEWPQFEGLDCNDCFTPLAQPFTDIIYTLKIADDNGCESKDEMRIFVSKEEQVFIPNVFSPNADNVNDFFFAYTGPRVRSILRMIVYDRWGGILFENSNFDPNEPSMGWDGTSNGKMVNSGVYVFMLNVEFIDGTEEVYSGDITIMR